jgi:hypothetical protein
MSRIIVAFLLLSIVSNLTIDNLLIFFKENKNLDIIEGDEGDVNSPLLWDVNEYYFAFFKV